MPNIKGRVVLTEVDGEWIVKVSGRKGHLTQQIKFETEPTMAEVYKVLKEKK